LVIAFVWMSAADWRRGTGHSDCRVRRDSVQILRRGRSARRAVLGDGVAASGADSSRTRQPARPTTLAIALSWSRTALRTRSPYRSAGEVHLPRVRSPERSLISIRPHTNHQLLANDPQRHMSADHEAETAHHLDLVDPLSRASASRIRL